MNTKDADSFLPLTPLWFNILLALADNPRHGYAIIKEIEARTEGTMSPATGTVYLALQRLAEDEVIEECSIDKEKKDNRRRRSYRLTRFGRRVMLAETQRIALQLGVAFDKGVVDPSKVGLS